MKKKLFAAVFACMITVCLPMTAWAAPSPQGTTPEGGTTSTETTSPVTGVEAMTAASDSSDLAVYAGGTAAAAVAAGTTFVVLRLYARSLAS